MTPVLWAAATGVVQTEATNPDTAAPASASRRFVSMLIIVVRRSFNATIDGDDYHDTGNARCCARAASGHAAAAPPRSLVNSRLFIRSPARRGRSALAAQSGRAPLQL